MDIQTILQTLLMQSPLAAASLYIAHLFIKKHEEAVQKIVCTFEAEVKACEERYEMVFLELMKIKEQIR